MSDVSLNGLPVLRGDLKLPYSGAWTAELELDADSRPTGSVTLDLLGRTFSGTVVADPADADLALSGDAGGFYRARIVGGAGGLGKPLEPQEWSQGAVVQQVLTAILSAGGESQAADIDPALLARVLPQWSFVQSTIGEALSALCAYLGVVWRIRRDGLVWVGTPSPAPTPAPDYIATEIDPEAGQAVWDLNEATVGPDQIIDGITLRQVAYRFDAGSLRALVTFAPGAVTALYTLFALWLRRVNLDYFRAVPGRIAAQDGTTVQFQPDDSRYSPLRRVAIRLGLPDTTVQIAPGARAVAAWEGAVPAAPVLASFGTSTASKIKVGVSATTQPTLRGTSYRNAQAAMNGSLATELVVAAVNLAAAGSDASLVAAAPNAAAALVSAATALGNLGAAKAINDFEAKSAQFLTTIFEAG